MSTTRGVRILVGSALASSVVLLGGCASSGTTSTAGGANPPAGGLTSHTSAPATGGSTTTSNTSDDSGSTGGSSSSSSSSDNSSSTTSGGLTAGLGGSDPGCQAALSDLTSGSQAVANMASNPAGALAGVKAIGDKLHADAGKSAKNASAINKVGDDYINLANTAAAHKAPDMSAMTTDTTALFTACSS